MTRRRYLLVLESDLEPRQSLGRFYKALARRYGIKVVDHRELPADSPASIAVLLQAANGGKEIKGAVRQEKAP